MDKKNNNETFTIIDVDGREKHKWSQTQLQALYEHIDSFVEDCTTEERKRFYGSLIDVKSFLLQRMQLIKMESGKAALKQTL